MTIGEQIHIKEGLEAHHTRTTVIVKNLVPEEGVMMKEEALDMSKKVGSIVTIGEVLPVLKLSMIGAEMIDLEMEGDSKNAECLMGI